MDIKVCRKCKAGLPFTAFNRNRTTSDGFSATCRTCSGNKAKKLLRKFGLTLEEYNLLLEKQGGACAVCKSEETVQIFNATISLSVDHNHQTGEVRGLLCRSCNLALGLLNEDPSVIQALAKYIEER